MSTWPRLRQLPLSRGVRVKQESDDESEGESDSLQQPNNEEFKKLLGDFVVGHDDGGTRHKADSSTMTARGALVGLSSKRHEAAAPALKRLPLHLASALMVS